MNLKYLQVGYNKSVLLFYDKIELGLRNYRRDFHRCRDYRFFCVHSFWNIQKIWAWQIELKKKPTSWRMI